MPLGIDATLRYALGNFDEPLTQSELATDSPYNTRLVAGLPPTPIGNPGLDAIEAAANPAKVDYLFYVVKPGTCGEHVFTATEAEFEQAAAGVPGTRSRRRAARRPSAERGPQRAEAARRHRAARRALALAGDAHGGARGAGPGRRVVLRGDRAVARRSSRRRVARAARAPASSAST